MRPRRCYYQNREYIYLRLRNQSYLQPHQRGIELIDVKTYETVFLDLSKGVEIVIPEQLPTTRLFIDLYPLDESDKLKFHERPKSFLLDIQLKRQAIQRDARKVNKSRKTTQELLDEALDQGKPKKATTKRAPRAASAGTRKTTRKPKETASDQIERIKRETLARLGLSA